MKRRRVTAGVATAAAAAALLAGAEAKAVTPTKLTYPAGAAGTWFAGKAFDACSAPSRETLKKWLSSEYRAVGIYMSGPLRACSQSHLTASWVTDVSAMGWKLLPLDVGLQAPCRASKRLRAMSRTPATAASQGAEAGRRAAAAAASLGMLPGSALYSDIEPFYAARDAQCTNAVRAYLHGWTRALHGRGYLAGVYGSHLYGVTALSAGYDSATYERPDAIWTARWNRKANTAGWAGVPDAQWSSHQRVKQFHGDHNETHGGATINIDSNIVDGPVATVALPYRVSLPIGLSGRMRPSALAEPRGTFAHGTTVRVVCQARTTAGTWDKLTSGTFLPDVAVDGGSAKPALPSCATPYQLAGGARLLASPAAGAAERGTTASGALGWVTCETLGTVAGKPGYWQRLEDGTWVAGALLASPDPSVRTTGVPLCPV